MGGERCRSGTTPNSGNGVSIVPFLRWRGDYPPWTESGFPLKTMRLSGSDANQA